MINENNNWIINVRYISHFFNYLFELKFIWNMLFEGVDYDYHIEIILLFNVYFNSFFYLKNFGKF